MNMQEILPESTAIAPRGDENLIGTALSLLESENSGLRRLVVELIEKNQHLRQQLQAAVHPAAISSDLRLPGSPTA